MKRKDFAPGVVVALSGRVLKALLDAVMDGELPNDRQALLSSAARFVTEL